MTYERDDRFDEHEIVADLQRLRGTFMSSSEVIQA